MSANGETVMLGRWHNYNGTTIWEQDLYTMTTRHWLIFNNFLVIFLTIVAERSWSIIAYALHQCGSHSKPRDGLRRSTEVYLRNLSNLNIVFNLGLLLNKWRLRARAKSHFKTILIGCLAILNLAGFQIASLFIPRIGLTTLVQLKSSPASVCGIFRGEEEEAVPDIIVSMADSINGQLTQNLRFESANSNTAPHFQIQEYNILCPFEDSLCIDEMDQLHAKFKPVSFDTGLIPFRALLINSPETKESRYVNNCSILDYESGAVSMEVLDPFNYIIGYRYYYGTDWIHQRIMILNEDVSQEFAIQSAQATLSLLKNRTSIEIQEYEAH